MIKLFRVGRTSIGEKVRGGIGVGRVRAEGWDEGRVGGGRGRWNEGGADRMRAGWVMTKVGKVRH